MDILLWIKCLLIGIAWLSFSIFITFFIWGIAASVGTGEDKKWSEKCFKVVCMSCISFVISTILPYVI